MNISQGFFFFVTEPYKSSHSLTSILMTLDISLDAIIFVKEHHVNFGETTDA